ncbi:MAG: hypothetical protein HWE18_13745 [Gammaproteobacteria bacterium]|nr:hypothetical protein [Gammaproteobacteria bacterium]
MKAPDKYPFFNLVTDQCQAEAALAALTCFGNDIEKLHLKPQATQLKKDFLHSNKGFCLAKGVNTLISNYVESFGELSDQLTIFISKSIHH